MGGLSFLCCIAIRPNGVSFETWIRYDIHAQNAVRLQTSPAKPHLQCRKPDSIPSGGSERKPANEYQSWLARELVRVGRGTSATSL